MNSDIHPLKKKKGPRESIPFPLQLNLEKEFRKGIKKKFRGEDNFHKDTSNSFSQTIVTPFLSGGKIRGTLGMRLRKREREKTQNRWM